MPKIQDFSCAKGSLTWMMPIELTIMRQWFSVVTPARIPAGQGVNSRGVFH
jgi:hypothetical protein